MPFLQRTPSIPAFLAMPTYSLCLSSHQLYTVMVTVICSKLYGQGSVNPLTFLFFKIILAVASPSNFPMLFKHRLLISIKRHLESYQKLH